MRLYYDFHIHTALSPCGDDDMTPNNIVNMALLNGLSAIAITDHNTALNIPAVIEAAKGTGLIVVPAMEVETSEEVHVLCLFPGLDCGLEFGRVIAQHLPPVTNKPEVFGSQLLFDSNDNVIDVCDRLLATATDIDLKRLFELVAQWGGAPVCAHVDRPSYSILSNLGFIPPDLDVKWVEFSKNADPADFVHKNKRLFGRTYPFLQSSDAHYLGDIAEACRFLEFESTPSVRDIINLLST